MKRLLSITIFSLTLGLAQQAVAQDLPYPKKHYNLKKGVAIQGYDPVAYFKENKAVEGRDNIRVEKEGVTYLFSSESNKKAFEANPSKYEPQYGGYCAYAMADGEKVRIDPETFKVLDGKLYLFYNFRFTNTLKLWNKDEGNLLPKANTEWKKIVLKG